MVFLKMEDLDLPEIKRKKIQEKKSEDKKEFKDLFQSDSDSDEDDAGLKIKSKQTATQLLLKLFNWTAKETGCCGAASLCL